MKMLTKVTVKMGEGPKFHTKTLVKPHKCTQEIVIENAIREFANFDTILGVPKLL